MHAVAIGFSMLVSLIHVNVDRGTQSGTLDADQIHESSGVAAGRMNMGMFWTHNDSRDAPKLYLIDGRGQHHGTWRIDGAEAVDWEDICSFNDGETAWLAIADTGDNARRRDHVSLYVVAEPALPRDVETRHAQRVKSLQRLDFTYRGGPQDCEAVGYDPVSRHFVIITKRPSGGPAPFAGPADVFLLPAVPPTGDVPRILDPVASISGIQVTACDVRADGGGVLLLTYRNALWYLRHADEPWANVFAAGHGQWIRMPFRRQGESVCFEPDGRHLFLTSEGVKQPVWRLAAPRSTGTAQEDQP